MYGSQVCTTSFQKCVKYDDRKFYGEPSGVGCLIAILTLYLTSPASNFTPGQAIAKVTEIQYETGTVNLDEKPTRVLHPLSSMKVHGLTVSPCDTLARRSFCGAHFSYDIGCFSYREDCSRTS